MRASSLRVYDALLMCYDASHSEALGAIAAQPTHRDYSLVSLNAAFSVQLQRALEILRACRRLVSSLCDYREPKRIRTLSCGFPGRSSAKSETRISRPWIRFKKRDSLPFSVEAQVALNDASEYSGGGTRFEERLTRRKAGGSSKRTVLDAPLKLAKAGDALSRVSASTRRLRAG